VFTLKIVLPLTLLMLLIPIISKPPYEPTLHDSIIIPVADLNGEITYPAYHKTSLALMM